MMTIVLEVLEGCGPSALRECAAIGPATAVTPTEIQLQAEQVSAVAALRSVVAAYGAISTQTRRPRGLLETSVQQRTAQLWEQITHQRPRRTFTGLRLAAAGSDTEEMRRIADALSELTQLPVRDDGDLLVRVRRTAAHDGWELLLRTTPRPLSTRLWRTVDYPGAVNATIAASVLDLVDVGADDAVLDMTCGSGTFLIEQSHRHAPRRAVGVDIDPQAIAACRAHQRAAKQRGRIEWICADVLTGPIEGTFTRILTNPPWGMLHGDHATNLALHRDLLVRAGQLAAPGARLGVLTQEIRRMRALLPEQPGGWRLVDEHRFFQKGHRPVLFILTRDPHEANNGPQAV